MLAVSVTSSASVRTHSARKLFAARLCAAELKIGTHDSRITMMGGFVAVVL